MSESPAFQFYAAEYLADENVGLMSIEDEGCYIRLIAYCWREGSIPADPQLQARLCKGVQPSGLVIGCFKSASSNGAVCDRLVHPRLDIERAKQAEWREKSAEGGRRSAHKRKHRRTLTAQQGGARVVQPKGNSSSSSSSSSSSAFKSKRLLRRAPDDFTVTDDMRKWARTEVPEVDIDAQTKCFMDFEFSRPKSDWLATWRNWMRKSKDMGCARTNAPRRSAFIESLKNDEPT